jgi:3',5'-cyclic AMP phosphodiesterase CpdA
MRIAHVSDLHVLSPAAVELRRVVFNKRITGYANLVLKRARVYRRDLLVTVIDAATRADLLVVTGDVTNLSLEGEYEEASRLLEEAEKKTEVVLVPGNHDIYLPAVHHERRFPHHFARFMKSELPELGLDLPAGHFPWVKLRGPIALIGLTSAVPRPPFVSAGYLGHPQLDALERVLAHPEVAKRTPVVLVHHSPMDSRFRLAQLRGGLVDASRLRAALSPLSRGLVLYGHLHVRERHRIATRAGTIDAVCATAAGLDHPDPHVRAGFNTYEIDDGGAIRSIEAQVLEPDSRSFRRNGVKLVREARA